MRCIDDREGCFFYWFYVFIIGLIFMLFFSLELHEFSGNLERLEDISLYYQLSFVSVYLGFGIMLIGILTRVGEGILILKNILKKSDTSTTIGKLNQNGKYVIKVMNVDPIQEVVETHNVSKLDGDELVEL